MDKSVLLSGWILVILSYYWLVSKAAAVKVLISATLMGIVLHYVYIKVGWLIISIGAPNPFAKDSSKTRRPYELNQKKRDAVIKQSFKFSKVAGKKFDAIVVGSGMGGLTTAAILAKAGKKVLVLEQHDQAGGCCHTFIDKNYEFDVGIHYIGEVKKGQINRTLLDQLTDGQLEWAELASPYDITTIGRGDNYREFPIYSDHVKYAEALKSKFPKEEHQAIDKYVSLIYEHMNNYDDIVGALKLIPLSLANVLIKSGILKFLNKHLCSQKTTSETIRKLTKNKELQTVFSYCWGDYGSPPDESSFITQALLMVHFWKSGAWYPIGGASEIAYNMIPVIEKSGGQVLVNVSVKEIVANQNTNAVMGVQVVKGNESSFIECPVVVSDAGVLNTFTKLLKPQFSSKSYYTEMIKDSTVKAGIGIMSVFVGLNKSGTELNLKAQNTWAFVHSGSAMEGTNNGYFNAKTGEDALDQDVPLLFISFPSEKDPNWNLHPERRGKSTVAIITMGKWEWFEAWKDQPLKRRGDSYDEIKGTLGQRMIDQTCELYPQIRDCIDYVEVGTPVTNNHYIGSTRGEIYGLDHPKSRMTPEMMAKLRPETDIPGLYLTGQDVLMGGFTAALAAGILTSCSILKRNVYDDMVALHKKLNP